MDGKFSPLYRQDSGKISTDDIIKLLADIRKWVITTLLLFQRALSYCGSKHSCPCTFMPFKSTFLGTAHQRCPSWYNFGAASGFTSWRSSHKWIALCTFRKALRSDLIALLTLNLLFPRQTWEEQASNHPWTAECHHWVCPTWLLKYVVISKQSPYPNVCNCDVECQPWKHTHPCTKYIWRSRLAFVLFPELCEPAASADPPFSHLAAADLIWTVLCQKLKQNKLLDHQDHHQTTVQRPNLWFPHNTFNKIFLCLKCKWYNVRGKR